MMNIVILIGNLVRNEEFIMGESIGSKGCIAVKRPFKNKNGEYESDFITFITYEKQAQFLKEYVPVGSMIGLQGRWQHRVYQDKENNNKYVDELIVDKITIIKKKEEENTKTIEKPRNEYEALKRVEEKAKNVEEDDLPF